jgi:hypothetical protein
MPSARLKTLNLNFCSFKQTFRQTITSQRSWKYQRIFTHKTFMKHENPTLAELETKNYV